MMRFVGIALAVALIVAACGSGNSGSGESSASGFIFIDESGSHVCGSMLESYPPQCGGPSTKLLDLDPQSVVALVSPTDPTFSAVSWTNYVVTVTGMMTEEGMSEVEIVEPTYSSGSSGMVLRVIDLGLVQGEPVAWPVDFTNLTDQDTTLTFSNGQRVEVTLNDDSGEVYRWSDGMFFTEAIDHVELPAGATLPYQITGEPLDLPTGEYAAKAWVTANESVDVVVTWHVELRAEG